MEHTQPRPWRSPASLRRGRPPCKARSSLGHGPAEAHLAQTRRTCSARWLELATASSRIVRVLTPYVYVPMAGGACSKRHGQRPTRSLIWMGKLLVLGADAALFCEPPGTAAVCRAKIIVGCLAERHRLCTSKGVERRGRSEGSHVESQTRSRVPPWTLTLQGCGVHQHHDLSYLLSHYHRPWWKLGARKARRGAGM